MTRFTHTLISILQTSRLRSCSNGTTAAPGSTGLIGEQTTSHGARPAPRASIIWARFRKAANGYVWKWMLAKSVCKGLRSRAWRTRYSTVACPGTTPANPRRPIVFPAMVEQQIIHRPATAELQTIRQAERPTTPQAEQLTTPQAAQTV